MFDFCLVLVAKYYVVNTQYYMQWFLRYFSSLDQKLFVSIVFVTLSCLFLHTRYFLEELDNFYWVSLIVENLIYFFAVLISNSVKQYIILTIILTLHKFPAAKIPASIGNRIIFFFFLPNNTGVLMKLTSIYITTSKQYILFMPLRKKIICMHNPSTLTPNVKLF